MESHHKVNHHPLFPSAPAQVYPVYNIFRTIATGITFVVLFLNTLLISLQ